MAYSDFHFHSNEARPLFYLGGTPVYLTTFLVALHVLALLLLSSMSTVYAEAVNFAPSLVARGQLWRLVTYVFVNGISIWTVVDLMFLFICGRQLEEFFGRKTFGILYALGALVPAVVLIAMYALTGANAPLSGPHFVHFILLLSVAFVQPNAAMFVCWLKLKWVALAYFLINVLGLVQDRRWGLLLAFVATCVVAYLWLRRNGLGPRFDAVLERLGDFKPSLPERRPKLRAVPGGRGASSGSSHLPAYEPKIRPRAELEREHPAILEIDTLLDKISREGLGSLNAAEKEALDRASAELKAKDKRV
jgi:membrane associated rhomboid family serine protease